MVLEFARGPDKKPRKTRSDKGKKRTGIRGAIANAQEKRARRKALKQRREELELRVLEGQAEELEDKQKKQLVKRL